ncbi:MAG: exosortase-associated EpsI family protein [Phycisphaerae bacterium]|jgi:hypothetical protein|nr:exosortase-associated EpsI family protein [Phycisphaerae bacterium]
MKLDTPPIRRLGRRIGRPAPLVTLAILLASPAVLARQSITAEDIQRQAAIVAGMENVPFQIGTWVGSPVPIPTDQQEILHPNALLSRQYSKIGERGPGTIVTMLLVHCSDVRDMDGHWPLHCYPKSGWTKDADVKTIKVDGAGSLKHDFAWVRFTIADGGSTPRVMTVFYTFILPDGRIETDMKAVSDRSKRKSDSSKGVAQFQFVFSGDVTPERCAQVAKELITGIPMSLRARLGMPTESEPNEKKEPGDA